MYKLSIFFDTEPRLRLHLVILEYRCIRRNSNQKRKTSVRQVPNHRRTSGVVSHVEAAKVCGSLFSFDIMLRLMVHNPISAYHWFNNNNNPDLNPNHDLSLTMTLALILTLCLILTLGLIETMALNPDLRPNPNFRPKP